MDRIAAQPEGTRLLLLAPVVKDRKGEYRKELAELGRRGFTRAKVDGTLYEIGEVPALNRKLKHDIEAVVDRIVVRDGIQVRLADSLETALALADGVVYAENAETGERTVFSSASPAPSAASPSRRSSPACSPSTRPTAPAPPATASASKASSTRRSSSRTSACPASPRAPSPPGPARRVRILRPDPAKHRPPLQGQHPHARGTNSPMGVRDAHPAKAARTPIDPVTYKDGVRAYRRHQAVRGRAAPTWQRRLGRDRLRLGPRGNEPLPGRETLRRLPGRAAETRSARGPHRRPRTSPRPASSADPPRAGLVLAASRPPSPRNAPRSRVASCARSSTACSFLVDVGLDYLTLARGSTTLSGGESQRIRLASQIGSGLTGVLYVLDEPSIGLHQRDNERLLGTLQAAEGARQHRAGGGA